MQTYSGKITTTGKSEAIRLDKSLFKSHPEFQQKAKVKASFLSRGHLLISLDEDDLQTAENKKNDPVLEVFLDFIAEDMVANPEKIKPISQDVFDRAQNLVSDIKLQEDEEISDNIDMID